MADTRSFILEIASENNIDPSRVESIIQKLLDEWYETSDSLKEISDAQWSTLSIPSRLVDLIKKKLDQKPLPEAQDSLSQLAGAPDSLNLLLEQLVSLDSNTLKSCIETLKTILNNLLNSTEDRFRKIKKSNPSFFNKVGKFPLALEFLRSVGFVDEDEYMLMKKEIPARIAEAVGRLEEILADVIAFNPYEANIISTNTDNIKIQSRENDPQAIKLELKKLESEEIPKIDRQPKIFQVDTPNLHNYFRNLDMQPEINDEDDEISQLANIQSVFRQREELSGFRNKRKNELKKAKDRKINCVTVRVRFPDKFVLQGVFSIKETSRDVYLFVAEHLQQKGREFYLYEAPPRKVIKNGNHKLQPFAPATLLHFSWSDLQETTETNGPFL
jgi:Mor family transcriptional regulator